MKRRLILGTKVGERDVMRKMDWIIAGCVVVEVHSGVTELQG